MPSADTSPDVQTRYDALWRQLAPAERFQRGIALILASRAMLIAGLQARYPHESPAQIRQRLCQQLYGVEIKAPQSPERVQRGDTIEKITVEIK